VAILSLALGIGANTAIFTLIDQVVLRKLPVTAPDQLVMLYQQGAHNGSNMGSRMHSYPLYQDLQKRAEPLAEVLCRRLVSASISQVQPHHLPPRAPASAPHRWCHHSHLIHAWSAGSVRCVVAYASYLSQSPLHRRHL